MLLKPASEGTGVIAGAGVRAVLELGGVRDILAKSLGTANPINLLMATVQGLKSLKRPEDVAKLRGLRIRDVIKPHSEVVAEAAGQAAAAAVAVAEAPAPAAPPEPATPKAAPKPKPAAKPKAAPKPKAEPKAEPTAEAEPEPAAEPAAEAEAASPSPRREARPPSAPKADAEPAPPRPRAVRTPDGEAADHPGARHDPHPARAQGHAAGARPAQDQRRRPCARTRPVLQGMLRRVASMVKVEEIDG